MNTVTPRGVEQPFTVPGPAANESWHSAVSWPAIFSGAAVAIAITLLLIMLGAGLGISSLSPWPNAGASATTFAISTAIGLIVVQWFAAATGGYMTGRLRTKWVGVHTHEVFFRDTAHGFLAWALATVVGTMFLASGSTSVLSGGLHAVEAAASGAARAAAPALTQAASRVSEYDVDSLFRSDKPNPDGTPQPVSAQASHILAAGVASGDVPAADRGYLAQLVASETGVSPTDAQKRVDDVIAREHAAEVKAKQTADAARKAASELAIFTALSMMIGAFIASAAAAYGGSLRDEH